MTRIKLSKEVKILICDYIAKELYNMHIKDKINKINDIQQEFIKQAEKEYLKIFNFTDEIINFCKKYNLIDSNSVCFNYNNDYPTTDRIIFDSNYDFNDDYISYSSYLINFCFPLYYKLSYIYINNNQETFNSKFFNDYAKYLFPYVKEISDISKNVKKDYLQFKDVVFSCNYVDEIEKFIPFKSVKEFLDKKYTTKLSTELCTINEEKIDFVKNYLKSKK